MDSPYAAAGSPGFAEEAQVARSPRSRFVRRAALAVVGLSTLAFAAPASATTETFNFTGAAQTWTVPAGITSATFDLYGAQGGRLAFPALAGGLGGRATATIAVTPGASIEVNVGGQAVGKFGGFNGGGDGSIGTAAVGGGGGGASDIRIGGTTLDDRVLVAGGGGGGGGSGCSGSEPVSGGDGGGESGDAGLASTAGECAGAVAGGGGTPDDGGSATSPATEGDEGIGGDGAFLGNVAGVDGGGGGGGFFGGGGGLGAAGGGGGSGYCPDPCTNFETGVRSGNGLVTVTYTAPNQAPTAVDNAYTTAEDTPLTVTAPGVLGNDSDPDGDPLSAVLGSGPSHGTLTLNANGSFSYTPAADYNGADSFTYRASDGSLTSNSATVTLTVSAANDPPSVAVAAGGSCGSNDRSGKINLTVGDPDNAAAGLTLTASSNNQALVPNANLSLAGSGANRTLSATAVSGRSGAAVITVTVSDGSASSSVAVTLRSGANGADSLGGTAGPDMLFGQNGNDTLSGLGANDLLCGGAGDDTLAGGDGDDTLDGAKGNDRLTGGAGADRFRGGPGTDSATDLTPAQGDTQDGTIP
jgi:VCBS repeat-containing protein